MQQQSEYKPLAIIAVKKLVIMPTTSLAKKKVFLHCLTSKTKTRNRFKNIDELMRGALEKLILPRIENIFKKQV